MATSPPNSIDTEIEDGETDDDTVEVQNTSSAVATFYLEQRKVVLKPNAKTHVEKRFTVRRATENGRGDTLPSILSMLTGDRVVPTKAVAPSSTPPKEQARR